jgi:succinate dehydrogenase / fumarate reductase flavoprotein subunit
MSTIDGLFVMGEANFSDHGANRLGASALMQGLADGYFIVPYTVGGYLAGTHLPEVTTDHPAFKDTENEARSRLDTLLSINGKRTVDDFHKELGLIMWEYCGMARNNKGLEKAKTLIQQLRAEFWENVTVPGSTKDFNQSVERAGRVADFLEFGELMIIDALTRQESCGGHFNEGFQTKGHEARRDDENFCHAAAWEFSGDDSQPQLHKEHLVFENVELTQRSYK